MPFSIACIVLAGLLTVVAAFHCTDFVVPITVTASSHQLAFPPFENHYESVAFVNAVTARNASAAPSPFSAAVNFTETFDISAEYCTPFADRGHKPSLELQVLTHGLGFSKGYWRLFHDNSEYNYVRAATEAGYSTLSYDRIGNGNSSKPDPYDVQQYQVELAILIALTQELKDGTLHADVCTPSKTYHVGHSYGSFLSHGLAAAAPSLSDGIVLTGYSIDLSYQGQFLIDTTLHLMRENQPARFAGVSSGYLTWADELANQYSFFSFPFFDPAVLAYAEANKWPFSLGEVVTISPLPVAATFDKPVLVISGDGDLIFCGGDCHGVISKVATDFPVAEPFEAHIQPHTRHGLNLHYNASGTYSVIQKFLIAHA